MENKVNKIEADEEINLEDIKNFFKRNKFTILKFASFGALVGIIISLGSKRIWRGEFQIVLEQDKAANTSIVQSIMNDPRVSGFAGNVGLNSKNKQLETEVEILRSPLVLFPIYDFVKQKKEETGKEFGQSYSIWYGSSISVNLKRGTSVLTFSYRDNDKDLIVPILEEISKKYQTYSGEERNKSIDIGLEYLGKQVKKYKKISSDSINKALSFAYLHNLINESEDYSALPEISSEAIRIEAVNKLNILEKQLFQINQIPNDSQLIHAFALNSNKENDGAISSFESLSNTLSKMDKDISIREIYYKESDPKLIKLKNERKKIISELKKQIVNDLTTKRGQLITVIEANTKPKEVITKYGELMMQASRDSEILMSLSANESSLRLKKAEIKEPWKLITKPTLDDYPVAPNRKIISIVSLILGTFIGTLFAYFREKRNCIIFSKNEIEKLFNVPLLEELNLQNKKETKEILQLIAINKFKIPENEKIAIIPIGNINKELIDEFIYNLKNFIGNKKIEVTKELSKARLFDSQLFIANLGTTKSNEIKFYNKLLKLESKRIIGLILI